MESIREYNLKAKKDLKGSKGEYFKDFNGTFDPALPHSWLVAASRQIDYDLIRSTTVWAYLDDYVGPVTCCQEVFEALS